MTDSIAFAACSTRRDFAGVTKDERCFFDDLSTRFEKLGALVVLGVFVELDLNIFAIVVSIAVDEMTKLGQSAMGGDDKEWKGKAFDRTKTKRERQCLNTYHGKAAQLRDE